jgi:CheY-like chemotaxis protein
MKISDRRQPVILIIEDIDWIRAGMKKSTELYGYRVVEARDDAEAIQVAERERPDLILTEEELPTFNALTARIRSHEMLRNVPIVIVNPDADEKTHYGDAVVLTGYEYLAHLLLRLGQKSLCE